MHGMNSYNEQLEAEAKKRRARLLKTYQRGKLTQQQIADHECVSRQRIQWMLKKAKEECE
jgi:DNA-binding transcriptional regulator LsrR (DeoR family)